MTLQNLYAYIYPILAHSESLKKKYTRVRVLVHLLLII